MLKNFQYGEFQLLRKISVEQAGADIKNLSLIFGSMTQILRNQI